MLGLTPVGDPGPRRTSRRCCLVYPSVRPYTVVDFADDYEHLRHHSKPSKHRPQHSQSTKPCTSTEYVFVRSMKHTQSAVQILCCITNIMSTVERLLRSYGRNALRVAAPTRRLAMSFRSTLPACVKRKINTGLVC